MDLSPFSLLWSLTVFLWWSPVIGYLLVDSLVDTLVDSLMDSWMRKFRIIEIPIKFFFSFFFFFSPLVLGE